MKRVVSVSLGSSRRDHRVETTLLGEQFCLERVGTDGDLAAAAGLIRELDGRVDAIGLGGIDLYLHAGRRRYLLRDAFKLAGAARRTPVVDGSGVKDTLERRVVDQLAAQGIIYRGQKTLVVCALDRFGLAESLVSHGCETMFGDLMFACGLPVPLYRLQTLDRIARMVMPVVSWLPFKYLYPTGQKQDSQVARFPEAYAAAELIAGDFHFIRRYLPPKVKGKIILTNTVTREDVRLLRERGADTLITTTPRIGGRSFGTNVIEGVLVAIAGCLPDELDQATYYTLLDRLALEPSIEKLAWRQTA
ncbi:MAG: quinate 5-dehydrogenase [Heliobacteriaceae bacterium]|nr:quinate 5-dehydrogenase [Heliobacteriaceae bacterium]MDD4587851.1 quinate 5-dehydrogenase [Heliobacteriaceae bacterium]